MSSPNNSDDDAEIRKKSRQDEATSSSTLATPTSSSLQLTNKRKSAFLPYRPTQAPQQQPAMVLTNLQRGNTEAGIPVQVDLSFHELAGQGEILSEEQVTAELNHGKTIDSKDSCGFTPLHYAAFYGHLNTVKLLLQFGADVNALAPELVTPLLLAACNGHHDVVKFLLQNGAKSSHQDILGNTALMYAAAGNHVNTCNEILAKDPDMTVTNENGDTAYTLAIEHGAVLSQVLLEQYMTALLSL